MEMTGRSERTVRKYFSQSRDDYEKQQWIVVVRLTNYGSQGLKWQQVADKMGCSYHGAVALYRRYVALDMPQNSL